MKAAYRLWMLFLLFIMLFGVSGCAILQIPGQIIEGTFGLLGKLLNVIGSLPKPPPWIFF